MKKSEKTGAQLRDEGIKQAMDYAEHKKEGWKRIAYKFLVKYIKRHEVFMCEDVRQAAMGIVPMPPHKRAWGGIVRQAAKDGIIHKRSIGQVKNPKAHRAHAAIWEVVDV
jgi:hypothetical protein